MWLQLRRLAGTSWTASLLFCCSATLLPATTFSESRLAPRSAAASAPPALRQAKEAVALQTGPVRVRLDTSKGALAIAVHGDWAPQGAERFLELVAARYFDNSRFFRVVKDQWAQFGINGDPKVATAWRQRTIPDDPRGQSVTRGRVAFAFAVPNGRTTQIYISLRDNSAQDAQGFVPFGEVVEGM